MKRTIKCLLIFVLAISLMTPIEATAFSQVDLPNPGHQEIIGSAYELKESEQYLTLDWLSGKYNIPQIELLQELNKGYSLQELMTALELNQQEPESVRKILKRTNPKVEENLYSMNFSEDRSLEKKHPEKTATFVPKVNGKFVESTGESTIISDEFYYDQIFNISSSNTEYSSVSSSVYSNVYDSPRNLRSSAINQSFPTTYDELAVKRLNMKVNGAPYSVAGNENVSLMDGSLQMQYSDIMLPGRNGLAFSLNRRYSSSDAIYYDKDIFSEPIYEVIYYPKLTTRLYFRYGGEPVTRYGTASDFYFHPFWTYQSYINYLSEYTYWVYPTVYSPIQDFNNENRRMLESAWSKVDPDDPNTAPFIINENINLHGVPLLAKAFTTGQIEEYPDSRKPVCEIYINNYCSKYSIAYGNRVKNSTTKDNRFPLGKGWSWDIPYIETKANDKKYITLFGGASYELDGLILKGYPWKDLTLSYDSSVRVNNVYSHYVLSNLNGQKQYFSYDGRLIQISDAYNNTVQFEFSDISPYGTVLTKVKDAIQNEINITYSTSEVLLTQGDRTVKYTKIKDPQGNKELLSQVTDPQGRNTSYVYEIAQAPFDLVGAYRPVDNYVALLKQVYHPTMARTDYHYTPFTRNLGYRATEMVYRTTSREDVVTLTNGSEQKYNHVDYSYSGDGAAVQRSNSTFSTTINNGRLQSTYTYDKIYLDDNTPEVIYNTEIKHSDGSKQRINLMEYDRVNKRPTPTRITSKMVQGTAKSSDKVILRTYDEYGNLTSETDPNQIVTTYTYDPATHLLNNVSAPVASGQTLFTEIERYPTYNSIRTVRVKENNTNGALKAQTSYAYDSYGNPSTITIKDNNRDINVDVNYGAIYYSGFPTSQSVQVTDASGSYSTVAQSFEYKKSTGEMVNYVDGKGNRSEYTYDKLGRITLLKNPDLSTHSVNYNDAANEVIEMDPTGVRMVTKWNPLGLKTQTGIEGKTPMQFGYDSFGRLVWEDDGLNQRIEYEYDAWDRTTRTLYPGTDRPIAMIEYDDINQINTTIDPEGYQVKQWYDILGRDYKSESYAPNGTLIGIVQKTFDYRGNVRTLQDGSAQDPSGVSTTQYAYDILGRLVSVTDPEFNTTRYTYSLANQLTQVQYADGSTQVKSYDQMGRLIQKTDPSGNNDKYYYDANSNLTKRVDRKGNNFNYSYNNRGFLKSVTDSSDTVSYDYDTAGRRLWMQDQTGRTSYSYDVNSGWLKRVTFPDQRTIQYEYDGQGKRTQMTDPFGVVTVYNYDTQNRLANVGPSINDWDVTYQYKKNGQPIQTQLKNGITASYDYSALNASLTQTKPNGAVINSFEYLYDLRGNQRSKTENGTSHTFTYDLLNRIDTSSQFNEDYSYDNRGNRLTLISEKHLILQGQSYQYDKNNRLTGVYAVGGNNVWYKYNGDGYLVERTEGDSTTRYYYDGSNIIAEAIVTNGTVAHKASYIRGNQLIARIDANGSKGYYVHNGHGDVVALLDGSGNTLNEYNYDIWGNPVITEEQIAQPFRYSGEFWDDSTGLQYLRARWYDPNIGRFINEDTYEGDITNPLSLNLYTYVHNNPLAWIDPSGHRPVKDDNQIAYLNNLVSEGGGNGIWAQQQLDAGLYWYDDEGDRNTMFAVNENPTLFDYMNVLSDPNYTSAEKGRAAINVMASVVDAGKAGVFTAVESGKNAITGIKNVANSVAEGAGKAAGWVKGLFSGEKTIDGLNFTKTTVKRMEDSNRYVPVQTLRSAIESTAGVADPQGSNALMHYTTMYKNGQMYNLEVLYDSSTNTVYHFLYTRNAIGSLPAIPK